METAPNEAIHLCWKQSLINSVYLQNLVSTVDQAVTLRCFESTRLPQSVLHASEPSSDFRRNHIADSIKKYLMWLFYSSNNLGWFACFRIQFLPDHIMIHSCLVCVCVCMCVYIYIYITSGTTCRNRWFSLNIPKPFPGLWIGRLTSLQDIIPWVPGDHSQTCEVLSSLRCLHNWFQYLPVVRVKLWHMTTEFCIVSSAFISCTV